MAGKGGGGVGGVFKKIGMAILVCGLLLALLQIFGDPFGIVAWLVNWFIWAVNGVADFFTGSQTFRALADGPN